MEREIKFRGKSKLTKKWVYGNLIIKKKKRNVVSIENDLFDYKYSINYQNKNGKYVTCEIIPETAAQYIGEGEYGEIYEGMKFWDEYAEENCTIEWDKEFCGYRLIYDGVSEAIETLDGLIPLEEK